MNALFNSGYAVLRISRTERDGKVTHETLGNLSDLPRDLIACMKRHLESGKALVDDDQSIEVLRTLPHG